MTYNLASYQSETGPRAGAVIADAVYDVSELVGEPGYESVADVLEDWSNAHAAIDSAAASPASKGQPLSAVTLLAPVAKPGAIYCIGQNYRDHAEEMRVANNRAPQADPRELGLKPFFFIKSSHSIAGPGETVEMTRYTAKPDFEIELVVVIGRKVRDISVDDALSCVAGYMIGNDLSARDRSARANVPVESLFRADWQRHKSFDKSAPTGPWITPADYVSDPTKLAMRLWVNDNIKQDSNSDNMIYTAAEQIAQLASGITLHPGDLIMTGTPAGVGMGRGEFLQAGDVVKMEIADIGDMSFNIA